MSYSFGHSSPVEHPDAIPTVIISDFEDSDEEDIDVEIPVDSDDGAPPRVGGTPPPPYPGSESDGESEMWETLDTEATEGVTEGPSPANDDPPLRLSAMRAARSALYKFTPYGPVPPLPHHFTYVMMAEEELFAQGESSAQDYARARQVVDRDEEISAERQHYEQEWADREESKAISARIRRELAWDEDPGSYTRPSNPDEPMDERRLWIRGNNFDYGERFVSVDDERMNEVEFEVNTTVSEATGESPFILQYGDAPMPALAPPDQLSDDDDHPHSDTASNPDTAQYTIVDHSRPPPVPSSDDECILRSLVMLSDRVAEQYLTFVDRNGNLYVKVVPLPEYHYLNPDFQTAHEEAMRIAIRERAAELKMQRRDLCQAPSSHRRVLARVEGRRTVPPPVLPTESQAAPGPPPLYTLV
ncbi:hypothetical protein DFH06DRAFT_1134223 [Mycena polygramma]|nr:hypothetical protein DFH06DRAFT_1134223 [Mycena polygramma]